MLHLIPADKLGEVIVSILVIIAAIVKWVGDYYDKKIQAESTEETEENEVEIITRKDFDSLLDQIKKSNETAVRARDSFEDTLACMTIIQCLLKVIAVDRRRQLVRLAEQEIFTFLRHSEFPSRGMVTTAIEIAIREIEEDIVSEEERKERLHSHVDSRPSD